MTINTIYPVQLVAVTAMLYVVRLCNSWGLPHRSTGQTGLSDAILLLILVIVTIDGPQIVSRIGEDILSS